MRLTPSALTSERSKRNLALVTNENTMATRVSPEDRDHLNELVRTHFGPLDTTITTLVHPRTWELYSACAAVENDVFPGLGKIFGLDQKAFAFWLVIGPRSVRHIMRMSFPQKHDGLVAPFLIHDLIRSGQITAEEVKSSLSHEGHPASRGLSIESSARVDPLSLESATLPAYLGLTRWLLDHGMWGVFAHQNAATRRTFNRVGMPQYDIMPGRELYTPAIVVGDEIDLRYQPRIVPARRELLKKFQGAVPVHVPVDVDVTISSDGEYVPTDVVTESEIDL